MNILGLLFFSLTFGIAMAVIWMTISANASKISMALVGHVAWQPADNTVYQTAVERRRVKVSGLRPVPRRQFAPSLPLAA